MKNFTRNSAICFIISVATLAICCYINCISNNYLEYTDDCNEFYLWLFDVSGRFGLAFIGFTACSLVALIFSLFGKKSSTH